MKRIFSRKLNIIHKVELGETNFDRSPHLHNVIFFYFFIFLVIFSFFLFSIRLFQLTVVKGGYYKRLSEENRIREIIIEPKRGIIMDRKGFVLAENKKGDVGQRVSRITSPRTYQAKEEAAHIIGYRQVADEQEIKNDNCINKLKLGDKVGKKGVEKLYDCELRGINGKKLTEVDAKGAYIRTISVIPPIDGDTIQLSLDWQLQKKAYELIKNKRAAVVALSPQTGQVLIFASSPSFDPQKFEDGNMGVGQYFTDKDKPLFDRVIEGTYPPGSIFKLFVATGGLEEKKIDLNTTIEDNGFIKAGAATFGNWYYLQYGKTEGAVSLIKAIRRSNDIYFYKAGEALGPEGMKKWAGVFGLNEASETGLGEVEGLIPSPFWKSETLKEQWYLGDTYNMSIGQGYTLLTPLQIARAALPFANGGNLCTPSLLKNNQPKCKKLNISPSTFSAIREGMKEACSPGGTGWPLFDFRLASGSAIIQTACKTGTAESHAKSGMPHAWFTSFAPFDNPEIAITVLIEEGGQGSDIGGPIVRDIFKAYFERKE